MFNFERLDILYAWIEHLSESYDHMSLLRGSIVIFREARYIIGLNRAYQSKVLAIWICVVLPGLISSISIYYAPESNIRVKSYDHLNFTRASIVQFRASQYIFGLNRTSESKVLAVWIILVLWCLISSISIYYMPESDLRVKCFDHMSFRELPLLYFKSLNILLAWIGHPSQKGLAIWICLVLPCLISSISIYYAPESRSECKLITIWISWEIMLYNFECLNILPESNIRVKSYSRLNLPCAFHV